LKNKIIISPTLSTSFWLLQNSTRLLTAYRIIEIILVSISWVLFQHKSWLEIRIPRFLELGHFLQYFYTIYYFSSVVLLAVYHDHLRQSLGFPPIVRTMGIPVKKFIVLHFGANVVNVFFFKNI
jgi:hypothetical protein